MNLNDFMRHLNSAFRKKVGEPSGVAARKAYGGCIAYLKKNPTDVLELSMRIDRLPPGKPRDFYVESVRMLVAELDEERKKRVALQRPYQKGADPRPVAEILKTLVPAGPTR